MNHRTVPLELLERMTVSDAHLPKALADLAVELQILSFYQRQQAPEAGTGS